MSHSLFSFLFVAGTLGDDHRAVPIQWMTWTVQGWLIAAQVLSPREFSELVLRKRSATLALWFSAIFNGMDVWFV